MTVRESPLLESWHYWVDTIILSAVRRNMEPVVIFKEDPIGGNCRRYAMIAIAISSQIAIEGVVGDDLASKKGCVVMHAGCLSGSRAGVESWELEELVVNGIAGMPECDGPCDRWRDGLTVEALPHCYSVHSSGLKQAVIV